MEKLKNLLLFFTFTIPKAGAKIGGFPLYVSLFSSLYFFASGLVSILRNTREIFFLLIPLGWFLIILFVGSMGVISDVSLFDYHVDNGGLVGYISSFFAFVCFYGALKIRNYDKWKSYIVVIFYMLVFYALMQKLFGDYNVVIPGVTANLQDSLTPNFLQNKNNMIWSIGYLKVTSTYQNGNLFGVNLLLLGFTVIANCHVEKKNYIFPLSCLVITIVLTASVSVYFGLVIAFVYMMSMRGSRSLLLIALVFLSVFFIIVMLTDNIISHMISERLINRDLTEAGGRSDKVIEYLVAIKENPALLIFGMLFYKNEFSQIYEILPFSLLQIFGAPLFIFLVCFYLLKLAPLFKTPYILPFIAYFSASLSDGAFWLPPTATNMCVIMGLCTLWKRSSTC